VTNRASDAARRALGDNLSLAAGRQALLAPTTLVYLVVHWMDQHFGYLFH
jgi:hypothetical protein